MSAYLRIFISAPTHHLKTNDTSANDNHSLGHFLQRNCAGACDDFLLVNLQSREGRRLAAGSDNNVLAPDFRFASIYQIDCDSVLVLEGSSALDVVDLVFLEQKLHTFRQTSNRLIFRLHHLGEVEFDISNVNATLFRVV